MVQNLGVVGLSFTHACEVLLFLNSTVEGDIEILIRQRCFTRIL